MKTLVEFLIDNCSDIFGENNSLLFSLSDDDSLDKSGTLAYICIIFIKGLLEFGSMFFWEECISCNELGFHWKFLVTIPKP